MSNLTSLIQFAFATPKDIFAQLVGVIPLVLAYFIFVFNDRSKIILTKTVSDILWALHFFLLGEISGAITNSVNTVRNIVFSQKEKLNLQSNLFPIFFCLITIVSNLLSQDGLKCIFPMVGSCLAIFGFWCSNPKSLKMFNLYATILWLIYGFVTFSIPTILCNLLSIISILKSTLNIAKY